MTNELTVRQQELSTRQRDFLLLTIFVLTQHSYIERARVLAEALHVLGDSSSQVALARAVLRFSRATGTVPSPVWTSSTASARSNDSTLTR